MKKFKYKSVIPPIEIPEQGTKKWDASQYEPKWVPVVRKNGIEAWRITPIQKKQHLIEG